CARVGCGCRQRSRKCPRTQGFREDRAICEDCPDCHSEHLNTVEPVPSGLTIARVAFGLAVRPSTYSPREPGMSAGYWLGVDLGGTKILSGLFDDDLKLLARSKQTTSGGGGAPGGVGGA